MKKLSVLVLPDMHVPEHDQKAFNACMKYAGNHNIDEVVVLGDFMTFDCISSHNEKNLRAISEQTVAKDYEVGNKVLDQLQTACGKASITLLEGNHEFRIERYLDLHPQVEGLLEVENGLKLQQRGIQWVRNWSKGEIYKIGKCSFAHGRYTNEHHAKKHAIAYGGNIIYGHTHDVQSYSLVRVGEHDTVVAQSLGCLCKYDQSYMQGQPDKWQQAFGHFYFWPNGEFQYNVVRIFGGKFIGPDGEVYTG